MRYNQIPSNGFVLNKRIGLIHVLDKSVCIVKSVGLSLTVSARGDRTGEYTMYWYGGVTASEFVESGSLMWRIFDGVRRSRHHHRDAGGWPGGRSRVARRTRRRAGGGTVIANRCTAAAAANCGRVSRGTHLIGSPSKCMNDVARPVLSRLRPSALARRPAGAVICDTRPSRSPRMEMCSKIRQHHQHRCVRYGSNESLITASRTPIPSQCRSLRRLRSWHPVAWLVLTKA